VVDILYYYICCVGVYTVQRTMKLAQLADDEDRFDVCMIHIKNVVSFVYSRGTLFTNVTSLRKR